MSMTRRSFLEGVAALVAGGILPVAGVKAAWEKLEPEPPAKPGQKDTSIQVKSYKEAERIFCCDDFERELAQAMSEEIGSGIDRVFLELMAEAAKPGMARRVFPVEGSV